MWNRLNDGYTKVLEEPIEHDRFLFLCFALQVTFGTIYLLSSDT